MLLSTACDSPSEPAPTLNANGYVLQSIDGVPLPAPWAPSGTVTSRMRSATLTLHEGGTGTWHAVIEETPGGATITEDRDLTYVLDGTHLEISYQCNDLGSCIAGPHLVGSLTSHGLTITTSLVTLAPLVFEAVPVTAGG